MGNQIPKVLKGEASKDPAKQKAKPKLPPRTPNILYSQSFGFCLIRVLLGAFTGLILRFMFEAAVMFIKN